MGASFEVEGLELIQKKILELGKKGKRIENKAIREGAQIVFEKMKDEVPVSNIDHLHIRDDIQISSVKRTSGFPVVEIGPGKETAWRAKFIELGTVKMPPDPFISRSVKLSRDNVKATMGDVLRRELGL